jgi:glutamine synthetase
LSKVGGNSPAITHAAKSATEASAFVSRQAHLVDSIRRAIEEKNLEVIIAGASDINGIFLGKRVPAARFAEHPLASVAVSDYFWVMDTEQNPIPPPPGYEGWWPSWKHGYGDVDAFPDLATFRVVPWLDRTGLVLCEHFFTDGRPVEIAPRRVLKRLIERIASVGTPKFAAELEFFLFRETEDSLEEKGYRAQSLQPLNPRLGAYGIYRGTTDEHVIRPLTRNLEAFGIPIEYWNPEGSAGQYEVNMIYADLPEAADRAFLFKHAIKEIAFQQGLTATFMAKVLPSYGSSCHLHQSVWSNGQNLFWGSENDGKLSAVAKHYIAGLVASLPELTLLFAPTINSYKRLIPYSAAGTTATWGFENRTAALRVLNNDKTSCRIENRVPGGDVNPYLAMAGCLAGGLYGLEHELQAPSPTETDAYMDPTVTRLPNSPEQAIAVFESSPVANEYLGEEFVRFYAGTRKWELEQFRANVTDWEIRRYLPFL